MTAPPDRLRLRSLRDGDYRDVAQLFFDAVQHGTVGAYSRAERDAWSGPAPNPDGWRDKIRGMTGAVAEIDGRPVGFMTIDSGGYIDLAFVAPDAARQGVGGLLYQRILDMAVQAGTPKLSVDASKIARGFFEQRGWSVIREQTVVRRGVALTNYRMELELPAG